MLQDAGIARHQSRRGKAEDLPERKVPGHHGQDHTQRLEGHKTPAGLGLHDFWREELRRLLGIEITHPGTLQRLRFDTTSVLSLGLNRDLFYFGLLTFRNGNGQHAIFEFLCRLVRFHSGG